MVAGVEDIEAERIDGARRPEAKRVDVPALPTDDRRVEGDRLHRLARMPHRARAALRQRRRLHEPTEAYVVGGLRPFELPRVAEREPALRIFVLLAVLDDLAEEAEIVTDAIADGGDGERRHALHEAGGKPAEAAIAERGVRF